MVLNFILLQMASTLVMKSLLVLILFFFSFSTYSSDSEEYDLKNKDVNQIMHLFEKGEKDLYFIDEPPCVLRSIVFYINSNKKLIMDFGHLRQSYTFSSTCEWSFVDIESFIPNGISIVETQ